MLYYIEEDLQRFLSKDTDKTDIPDIIEEQFTQMLSDKFKETKPTFKNIGDDLRNKDRDLTRILIDTRLMQVRLEELKNLLMRFKVAHRYGLKTNDWKPAIRFLSIEACAYIETNYPS